MIENQKRNLKLTVSWNGEKFSGYQYQPHVFTVQEALTNAWFILSREQVELVGCSRLDAGVHAQHYVLNFYTDTVLTEERILKGLNGILHSHLQLSISIYAAEFVAPDFHSRFHALGKHYRYLIWYGFAEHSFFTPRCWHVKGKLSLADIQLSLQEFIGEHDFAAFRSSDCSAKTTVRRIFNIDAWSHPFYSELLVVDVWGDGFLKNMIRNIVGTAVQIANGQLHKRTITDAFLHKDRTQTGMCAPAKALSLMQVFYIQEHLQIALQEKSRLITPS
jgi:tRNA pseudouridine38-40 synthase